MVGEVVELIFVWQVGEDLFFQCGCVGVGLQFDLQFDVWVVDGVDDVDQVYFVVGEMGEVGGGFYVFCYFVQCCLYLGEEYFVGVDLLLECGELCVEYEVVGFGVEIFFVYEGVYQVVGGVGSQVGDCGEYFGWKGLWGVGDDVDQLQCVLYGFDEGWFCFCGV